MRIVALILIALITGYQLTDETLFIDYEGVGKYIIGSAYIYFCYYLNLLISNPEVVNSKKTIYPTTITFIGLVSLFIYFIISNVTVNSVDSLYEFLTQLTIFTVLSLTFKTLRKE
jgi:hypothetical protein